MGRPGVEDIDYILAEAHLRWRKRVFYPLRLRVGVRVSLLGRKHFVMEYAVEDGDGERLVTGETTQVMFDYEAGATARIPDDVRAAIEAVDGPFGHRGRPAG